MLILSPDELAELTGYRLAPKQLEELHRQGFYRARRAPVTGRVILERGHYEAVCGGNAGKPPPRLRMAA